MIDGIRGILLSVLVGVIPGTHRLSVFEQKPLRPPRMGISRRMKALKKQTNRASKKNIPNLFGNGQKRTISGRLGGNKGLTSITLNLQSE